MEEDFGVARLNGFYTMLFIAGCFLNPIALNIYSDFCARKRFFWRASPALVLYSVLPCFVFIWLNGEEYFMSFIFMNLICCIIMKQQSVKEYEQRIIDTRFPSQEKEIGISEIYRLHYFWMTFAIHLTVVLITTP